MAKGPWDTGTWDDAEWSSLPVSGNAATSGVGSLGRELSVALTGAAAIGNTGTIAVSNAADATGVSVTTAIGNVSENVQIGLIGVSAQGFVGDESENVIVALVGASASGDVGTLNPSIQPIIIDDTHDGDYLGKRLRKEREEAEARRRRVLALYERIVEGKKSLPDAAEYIVTRAVEAAGVEARADILKAPSIDLGRIMAGLERASAIQRDMQLEADDEEVMLLL